MPASKIIEVAFLRAILSMAESNLENGRFRKAQSLLDKARALLVDYKGPLKERLDAEHILRRLAKRAVF